jgi:hypothetical protein
MSYRCREILCLRLLPIVCLLLDSSDTLTYGRDGVAKRSNVRLLESIFRREIVKRLLSVALCR